MQLVDIGANLTHDSFDRDRDAVLVRVAWRIYLVRAWHRRHRR